MVKKKKIKIHHKLILSERDLKNQNLSASRYFINSYFFFHNSYKKKTSDDYNFTKYNKVNHDKTSKKITKYYEFLLKKLVLNLNQQLNIKKNKIFWRILIGPWLKFFTCFSVLRWNDIKYLESTKKKFIYDEYNFKKFNKPFNTSDFNNLSNQEKWNSFVYSKIIKLIKSKNFELKRSYILKKNIHYKKNLNIFKSKKIVRDNLKYFFFNSYLGRKKEFLTSILLKTIPSIFSISKKKFVNKKKNKFFYINIDPKNTFELFLQEIINYSFPTCFYENFFEILEETKNFPKKPKNVLTSIDHEFNEVFKMWLASKKSKIKLSIFQHGGGSIGMSKFSSELMHDIKISDNYFTWGWSNQNKNVKPLFFVKRVESKQSNKNKIIFCPYFFSKYPRNFKPIETQDCNLDFLKNQEHILKYLNRNLKGSFIRLGINEDYILKYYKNLIKKKYQNLNIDTNKSFSKSLSEAKIILTTYNSTVLLESIYLNIPVVAIWEKNHFYHNSKSKKFFNILKQSNVIHYNMNDGLKFLKNISTDPNKWWKNPTVSENVNKFSNYFCNRNFSYNSLKKNLINRK